MHAACRCSLCPCEGSLFDAALPFLASAVRTSLARCTQTTTNAAYTTNNLLVVDTVTKAITTNVLVADTIQILMHDDARCVRVL